MKIVNEQSKQILDKLWELANGNGNYFKLNNDDTYMPLTIEIIAENQISLCHYGEQNGDLMTDPEMVFWKDNNGDYFPIYFRNDYVGVEEFLGQIVGDELKIINDKQQKDQTEFADTWLLNIKYQQNL